MSRTPWRNEGATAGEHHHQLPNKAAVEGPAICFGLLEIEQGGGMTHEQFVRLLMSATVNRYTTTGNDIVVVVKWVRVLDVFITVEQQYSSR